MGQLRILCAALLAAFGAAVQAGPLAYVPNEKSATLSVIDTATDTRQADIPAGQPDREMVVTGPPKANAYAADGAPTPAALGFARA